MTTSGPRPVRARDEPGFVAGERGMRIPTGAV